MGSVKDIKVIKKPQKDKTGIGQFIFSDRYSVFDWGEMPDHIIDKGKALCLIGSYFFEKFEELGYKTHYLGLVEDGKTKRLSELISSTNCMEFRLLRVLHPIKKESYYDYSIYKKERSNYLIPLEVIYRNYIPKGASLLKRLNNGKIKPEDIGLKKLPKPGERLKNPIIEASTKLEASDRYLDWKEAEEIAGLTWSEKEEIQRITLLVNKIITKETEYLGLINLDGKVEYGFDEFRNPVLVDVFGTPDECRFTYNELPLSKEIARIFYRKTSWYKETEIAKKQNRLNWKEIVRFSPPKLPDNVIELISQIYKSIANDITKRTWFASTPPLRDIMKKIEVLFYQEGI